MGWRSRFIVPWAHRHLKNWCLMRVFGVEVCSTVIDSYSRKESNGLVSGSLDGMMDLDPYKTGTLSGKGGTYVEWVVENLEGSKWNSFNVVGGEDVARWVFELYGYQNVSGEGE